MKFITIRYTAKTIDPDGTEHLSHSWAKVSSERLLLKIITTIEGKPLDGELSEVFFNGYLIASFQGPDGPLIWTA